MQKSWGACEQRVEVLLEMKKESGSGGCDSSRTGGGGGGGVRWMNLTQ